MFVCFPLWYWESNPSPITKEMSISSNIPSVGLTQRLSPLTCMYDVKACVVCLFTCVWEHIYTCLCRNPRLLSTSLTETVAQLNSLILLVCLATLLRASAVSVFPAQTLQLGLYIHSTIVWVLRTQILFVKLAWATH